MNPISSVPQLEAESLAFFEPDRKVMGIAGPQVSILFSADGKLGFSVSDVQQITTYSASHWAARMETADAGRYELDWRSLGEGASLDSSDVMVCRVTGKIEEAGRRERRMASLGIATLPSRRGGPPVLRSLNVVFDEKNAFFLNAYRPAVYHGHGDERNDAILIVDGEPRRVDEARLSTVYSKDDLHVQASVELYLEGEELPRRLTGEAIEGTHVELTDRDVALAFYNWTMGPHTGVGYYEIALAAPPRRAA